MTKTLKNEEELLVQRVKIPFKILKRGKHKPHIIKPNNSVDEKIMDDILVQALGKAKLWENELMRDEIDLEEFCEKKKLTMKYVIKVLRLNTLSPGIKAAIMNGTQAKTLVLKDLLKKPFPLLWGEQERM
ncbi:hypothetical protein FACS1894122_10950 [Alphaproteobacteria bacterium]|nr:hypothetical protein FACS1894122_10950 [Alphaproteobacteria bacterium]